MAEQNDQYSSGVYAPEVIDFVSIANDYCIWLEESHEKSGVDFIQTAVSILPALYHRILLLKETEPLLEGGNEKFVTEKEWADIFQKILQLLGPHNTYLRVAGEEEYDRSDLVSHKISEDLADIYQDLKDFTLQFRQGIEEVMNDAVWEVMSSFEQYWGARLLDSLRAVHTLYINKTDPEMDSQGGVKPSGDEDSPTYDNTFFTRLQDLNEEEI